MHIFILWKIEFFSLSLPPSLSSSSLSFVCFLNSLSPLLLYTNATSSGRQWNYDSKAGRKRREEKMWSSWKFFLSFFSGYINPYLVSGIFKLANHPFSLVLWWVGKYIWMHEWNGKYREGSKKMNTTTTFVQHTTTLVALIFHSSSFFENFQS